MRGSNPGERRGGRQAGTPNRATREIRELTEQFVPEAIKELGRLAKSAKYEATRLAAIREILDRRYGKASQTIGCDPQNPQPITDPSRLAETIAFLLTKQAIGGENSQQNGAATKRDDD